MSLVSFLRRPANACELPMDQNIERIRVYMVLEADARWHRILRLPPPTLQSRPPPLHRRRATQDLFDYVTDGVRKCARSGAHCVQLGKAVHHSFMPPVHVRLRKSDVGEPVDDSHRNGVVAPVLLARGTVCLAVEGFINPKMFLVYARARATRRREHHHMHCISGSWGSVALVGFVAPSEVGPAAMID
ncbi:hypothetical protein K438DRAFT_1955896 [Mycena galopus ATCC 62051]|nr:hypothetical protein K438DRAFT_1955896 [Mycena galopus ATCC 62051]